MFKNNYEARYCPGGHEFYAELDSWAKKPTLWITTEGCLLSVAEGDGVAAGKSFALLSEINSETGAVRTIDIPFNAEDMCFDLKGFAYLRSVNRVVRYDPSDNWREVPWDYGEERSGVGFGWMGPKRAKVVSALVMPADANWHHGGMHVSEKGYLIVACGMGFSTQVETKAKYKHDGKGYRPKIFPGTW